MIRLIYASRSLDRFPRDLKQILSDSQVNNAKVGVTGALCFLDGVYLQYLEGETTAVEDLYRKILADPRHTHAKLFERRRIQSRIFETWSMALVTWNEQTLSIFKALNPGSAPDLWGMSDATAATTFEALARSANWQTLP